MNSEEDNEEYWEESEKECWEEYSSCTISHPVDEVCPECCWTGGDYQPGTEECDFCPWAESCARAKYG